MTTGNGSPESSVSAWFRSRLARVAEPPRDPGSVMDTDSLRYDLAVDSLAFIELMVEFEDSFGVRLEEADLLPDQYDTVRDLTSHVSEVLDRGRV